MEILRRVREAFSKDEIDKLGMPREWLHCGHCGAYSWRVPPHHFEPCPLVLQMTEAAGLKMDAERATAIRSGVQIENFMRMMQQQFGDDDDDE